MENVPAMSGINESAAALKNGVKTTAVDMAETDVLANIVPQLRNGYGAEALKNKNCGPAEIDGCNASVIETTSYAPYPGLRGVHNNEESANNIVSEDCVDDVVQEDIKNVVPLINEKSAALQKNYIMLHYVMQYYIKKNYIMLHYIMQNIMLQHYIKKNYIMLHIMQHIILHYITSKDFIYIVSDDFIYIVSKDDFIYIVSEDYIMQEDINNVVPLINEKSAALRKNKNKTGILEAPKTSNLSGGAAEAAKTNTEGRNKALQKRSDGNKGSRSQNESQSQSQSRRESRSQNQSQSGSKNHCQSQSQSQSQRTSQSQSQSQIEEPSPKMSGSRRKPGDVRQDVRHPRNPRVITISETAGSSAELRLRRRAQGGCAVEGYTRAISNRATTTMRDASATTTMRLWHADRRSRGMCCQGRIEKRRTESRIERLQREEGSVVRPLRGPL